VQRSRCSIVQSSAYSRIGLEPMKQQHSIGTPVRCWISAIGCTSATTVRAAQFALMRSLAVPISRARRSTSRTTCGPAPGRPMSAVSTPMPLRRWRISSFCSIEGARTDGDCSPSRSVSSSSITSGGFGAGASRFQS
jgi:hypothetical protein